MAIQFYADAGDGSLIRYYNDDIHDVTQIPTTAIKITEDQWQDSINNPGKYVIEAEALALAPAEQQLATAQAAKIAILQASMDAELDTPFTYRNLSQLMQMIKDGETFVEENIKMKFSDLKAQVNAATTVDVVNAIVW